MGDGIPRLVKSKVCPSGESHRQFLTMYGGLRTPHEDRRPHNNFALGNLE